MTGTPSTPLRRALRTAILAAALIVPANASTEDQTQGQDQDQQQSQQSDSPTVQPIDDISVAEGFADLRAPVRRTQAQPGAVDITEIEIPVELPPPPPPPPAPTSTRSMGSGIASYYGARFHGRRTANGERFNMNAMTAAHKTLPFGTKVLVTNPRNGRSVTVRINDRGPFTRGREIDLSRAAAKRIGLIARGHGRVQLAIVR